VLQQINIDELVTKMVNMDGSDLHLKVGSPSAIRARGLLQRLEGYEVLRPADTEDMVRDMMSEGRQGV
jgi:twitching motility protein PilT